MPSIRERFLFARESLRDRDVAYLFPTSESAVRSILRHTNLDADALIVEYGPGMGAFGEWIVPRLKGKLVLIEKNPRFASHLAKKFASAEERVDIHCADVRDAESIMERYGRRATTVLSGIPFSYLPKEATVEIMQATKHILLPGCPFLVYQVRDYVGPYLESVFDHVSHGYIWHNLFPPLHTYKALDSGGCKMPVPLLG